MIIGVLCITSLIHFILFQHRPLASPSKAGPAAGVLQAAPLPAEAVPAVPAVLQEQLRVPHVPGSVLAGQCWPIRRALRRVPQGKRICYIR